MNKFYTIYVLLWALTYAEEVAQITTIPIMPEVPAKSAPASVSLEPMQPDDGQKKPTSPKKGKQELDDIDSMADLPFSELEKKTPELEKKEFAFEERQAFSKLGKSEHIHLAQYLEPWQGTDPKERVEMNFDNKELTELLKFLSENLDVTFILDDDVGPMRAEGLQPLEATKITFKSQVPVSLKEAWEYGLTFLEMAGFSVIPGTIPRTYRVTASASPNRPSANKEALPTFIGTDPELIPDNDTKIRYVYFAENAELPTITQIIQAMQSGSAGPLIEVPPLRAVIMTDKAATIRSIINILAEIDRVSLPETLAVIRLKHADATKVRELYHRLIGKDPSNPIFNPFSRQRKQSTTQYFTEATRVFEEPYTNSLIVLGTKENIKKFEDFILKYIDRTLDIPFSPLHIIKLKYMDATATAKVLNDVIRRFNEDPANAAAAAVGGVRDGNKFFRPTVRITEEASRNLLLINADYEEYLMIRELIEKIDVEQPQVIIKALILNVDLTNAEQLGTQLRNAKNCCDCPNGAFSVLGSNVNFQSSTLGPIITREDGTGATRLLGNLLNLANLQAGSPAVSPFSVGTTLVTLGKDIFGFWGLLRALETYTRVSVVANPFLVATHKYKAEFRVGETRRTVTAIVQGTREATAQGDISADLRLVVTPIISYDDMVTLNVYIELGQFTDDTSQNRIIRKISTEAILANREVLALGGLIRDRVIETTFAPFPLLSQIPLIGWLFKNKSKTIERTSLLILIVPEIIKPHEPDVPKAFTFGKINDVKDSLVQMQDPSARRDPLHRWIFKDNKDKEISTIDKFVSVQQRYLDESQRKTELIALDQKPKSTKNTGILDLIPSDEDSGVPA